MWMFHVAWKGKERELGGIVGDYEGRMVSAFLKCLMGPDLLFSESMALLVVLKAANERGLTNF